MDFEVIVFVVVFIFETCDVCVLTQYNSPALAV